MAKLQVEVTAEDHSEGAEGAAVTLVEYGDYQCPHCATAHEVVERLRTHYGDGLRFVFRNFPLEMHPMAEPAAEAAEFAASQGKFWPMHDAIFENQESLSVEMLVGLAEQLGMKAREAEASIAEERFAERIDNDVDGGDRAGVHGTPTFFVNGQQHKGSFGYEAMVEAIDAAGGKA